MGDINYLMWRGDMLMKKTVVLKGSMLWSTQSPNVLNTLSYAIGRLISSYSVSPSSNDPRLFSLPQSSILSHSLHWASVCISISVNYYLQDFDGDSVHPPDVTIEDKKVNAFPVDSMLLDRLGHYYTVEYTVHFRIVWIRFHQKWRPIKLHRRVIILFCLFQFCISQK